MPYRGGAHCSFIPRQVTARRSPLQQEASTFLPPPWKLRWNRVTDQRREGWLRPQRQPSLDGQSDSVRGNNRLGSRCSFSYALLTNRKKNREEGNWEAYDQKELPLGSVRIKPLGRPRRHICGALFTFAKPFRSCPLIGHSDCTVFWVNGSLLPTG